MPSISAVRNRNPFTVSDYLMIAVVVTVAIWYISHISDGALWRDEVHYAIAANSIFAGNPFVNIVHMFAPLGKYIIGIGQLIFGTTSFGARIGIVLSSLITLAVIYLIARQLGKPWVGLLTVISVSILPLFSTHATSAMLDVPLVAGVTAISGLVLLEGDHSGNTWRDAAVGVSVILASATKAYGFVYIIGPLIAYILLRQKSMRINATTFRIGIAAAGASIVTYLPLMLAAPPEYYSGAKLPKIALATFDLPLLGGPAYAFSASLYYNLAAGHAGAASPSLIKTVSWLSAGGPLTIVGAVFAVGAYTLPQRWRYGPWWTPGLLLLPPFAVFGLMLPKGYTRYALPIFPIAILYGNLVLTQILRDASLQNATRKAMVVILVLLAISPASAFLFGDQKLSADSQYDEVAAFISETEGEQVVLTEERRVLTWYLGDRYIESYDHYLDPTRPRKFDSGSGGHITVLGSSPAISPTEKIRTGEVDYVILTGQRSTFRGVNLSAHGKQIRTWPAYSTGGGTYQVTIWQLEN